MRKVYIDIATTGMELKVDRIVEIAVTEVINGKQTGIEFHCYINPDNLKLNPAAEEVNGYGIEFLKDKPRFIDIAEKLARLFEGAEMFCFGADFDLGFLKEEFARLRLPILDDSYISVVDLRLLAKSLFPNQRINLEILFKKFALIEVNKDLPVLLSKNRRLFQLHQALLSFG